MLVEVATQHQLNFVQFLLFTGGWPLLAFGIVVSIWGIINIVRVPGSGWILAQAWMSFLPGIFALLGIYVTYQQFAAMAISTEVVEPTDVATVAGAGMSLGFLGIVSTIMPFMLSLVAFRRYCRRNEELRLPTE